MEINLKNISKLVFLVALILSVFMILAFVFIYFVFKKGNLLFFITSTLFFGSCAVIFNLIRKGKTPFIITDLLKIDRSTKVLLGICSLIFSFIGFYSAFSTPKDKTLDIFGALLFGLGGISLLLPDEKKQK